MNVLKLEEVRVAVLEALEGRLQAAGLDIDEIDGNFDLFGSGFLDSLGFVDLLMNVEQKLGQSLELDELDFGNLETLDALVEQLQGLTSVGER